MSRTIPLTVSLLLVACGGEPTFPADSTPSPLVEAASPGAPVEGTLEVKALSMQRLRPAQPEVLVHSFAAPDGAEVHYLLGVMSCGIYVVAQGTATVQGGSFVVPYDAAAASGFERVSLYFQVTAAGAQCDASAPVLELETALPASIDLSTLPAPSYAGCWMFELLP